MALARKHDEGVGGDGGVAEAYMVKGHNEDWLDPDRRLTTTSVKTMESSVSL